MRLFARLLPAAVLMAAVMAGPGTLQATAHAQSRQSSSSLPACTQIGTSGNDVIVANSSTAVLCGKQGKDTLVDLVFGGAGDQTGNNLRGGFGDDVLRADDGDNSDTLIGGPGNDTCIGDAGDTYASSCEHVIAGGVTLR